MKLEPSPPGQVACFAGALFLGGLTAITLIPPARRVAAEFGCGNPMLSALIAVSLSVAWGAFLGAVASWRGTAAAGLRFGIFAALPPLAFLREVGASVTTMAAVTLVHLVCGLICGYLGGRQRRPDAELLNQGEQSLAHSEEPT